MKISTERLWIAEEEVASKPLTVQKFNRLKCLHGTDYLFDGTGQKIDLDFAGRKFVRLAGQIFVRLAWSRVYGAPEGTRKLKSFEWLDCTNNKVLNVAIAQTIKFRMSRLHKQ